jgi:hypothetical protein
MHGEAVEHGFSLCRMTAGDAHPRMFRLRLVDVIATAISAACSTTPMSSPFAARAFGSAKSAGPAFGKRPARTNNHRRQQHEGCIFHVARGAVLDVT